MQTANKITDVMKQALDSNESISRLITETNNKATIGSNVVSQAVAQIDLVHQATSETADRIDELGEKSNKVNEIIGLITEIC